MPRARFGRPGPTSAALSEPWTAVDSLRRSPHKPARAPAARNRAPRAAAIRVPVVRAFGLGVPGLLTIGLLTIGLLAIGLPGPGPAVAADHLLLSEFAVRPTAAEFFEIYNPTGDVIDLSTYYVSDYILASDPTNNYWRMVDGALQPDLAFPNDFLGRFPDGSVISPGQTVVVSLHDAGEFSDFWSSGGRIVRPDYEVIQDGSSDGIPDLVDPGFDLIGRAFILPEAGLSNDRECIVLFRWDGESDLVEDVDIVQWGNAGPDFNTLSPDKTDQEVDGPDPGSDPSPYLPDTNPQGQDLASTAAGAHDFGNTVTRIDFDEGTETLAGGNGITGHDETSENYSATWLDNSKPSLGSPGAFGPPTLLGAFSRSATAVDMSFSRPLDPVTAGDLGNYTVVRIESAGGAVGSVPLTLERASLTAGGETVRLITRDQSPGALYEVRVVALLSEDLGATLVPGSRAFFRGYRPGPELRLDAPRRPFVPHLDGRIEITYVAPQGEGVLLRVFDTAGRELFVLADEIAPPGGVGVIEFDGRDDLRQKLPAGFYLLHLETPATGDETVAPLVIGASSEETLR